MTEVNGTDGKRPKLAEKSPYVLVTRREQFSAAHRLHSPHLTDEQNKDIFGKCNNPKGHGHNYTVEITVGGPVMADTGMVMNLVDLKKIIENAIMKRYDHKHLDEDTADFKDQASTTENLAVMIYVHIDRDLKQNFPTVKLEEVKIWETGKNMVRFRGHWADEQYRTFT
eukprot:Clim_evm24s26 gene=Clim_evmTU24s26